MESQLTPTFICLICEKARSSNFLFMVGVELSRHFSQSHRDVGVGDRTKFIKQFKPQSICVKVEEDEDTTAKTNDAKKKYESEDANKSAPIDGKKVPLPPPELDDWNVFNFFLQKKVINEQESKRQLVDQKHKIDSLETELGDVRNLLETREAEKAELQVNLRNIEMERDAGKRREFESWERLCQLESAVVKTMKQHEEQTDLKGDLERANARCKRKDERNAYLQKENENLKKRLKTIADSINLCS